MPKVTAKQIGGDDGYCWAILVDGKPVVEGLKRSEVPYYRKQVIQLEKEKLIRSHKSTHHNNLLHIDCPECQKESPHLIPKKKEKK